MFLISAFVLKVKSIGANSYFNIKENEDKELSHGSLCSVPSDDGNKIFIITLYGITEEKIMDNDFFVAKLFTMYHEIGHLNLEVNKDDYDEKQNQIFDIENKIIEVYKNFYNKYHDDFFIEKEANSFAINNLRNDFDNVSVQKICDFMSSKLIDSLNRNSEYLLALAEECRVLNIGSEKNEKRI